MVGSSRPQKTEIRQETIKLLDEPLIALEDYEGLLEDDIDDDVQASHTTVTDVPPPKVHPEQTPASITEKPVDQLVTETEPVEHDIAAVPTKGKRKRGSLDEADRYKRMKIQGTDQELLVDMTRVVKYSDKDKQDHAPTGPADFRATIDYGDL